MSVSRGKYAELASRMHRLGIQEEDLVEKFVLSSGPGGQKVNKTSSAVYLKHEPSGIEVKCGKERSQQLNRYFARKELCERLEKKQYGIPSKKEQIQKKIKKQKKRRARKHKPFESN